MPSSFWSSSTSTIAVSIPSIWPAGARLFFLLVNPISNEESAATSGTSPGGPSKMSGATIGAVVFFSLVGAYFVLGVAYGKYKHGQFAHPQASGVRRFFYLVGDGFGFALNGCALLRKPFAPTERQLSHNDSFEMASTKEKLKAQDNPTAKQRNLK